MGKLALLLVLAATGAAVYHGASAGQTAVGSAAQAAEVQRSALSRAAAKTGWERAKQDLAVSFAGGTRTGQNGGSSYTVTTTVSGDEAVVVSEGRTPAPGMRPATRYTLTYRLRAKGGGVPPFAANAMTVGGDLLMSGNGAIVTSGVAGPAGDSLNIHVHANGRIHAGSASTVVEGFGSHTGGATGKLQTTFQPRTNPDASPLLTQADSVHIPRVVPAEAVAAYGGATRTYPPTADFWDARIRGHLPGGTRDRPAVYYVQGNALLLDVTVSGYAVFIADGEVGTGGGFVKGTPEPGRDESALAIITPSAINMQGGSDVHASLFADGGLRYNGNVDIYGSLTAGGDFAHGGGATLHYVPASPGLFRPWAQGEPVMELLAYREQ